ncbi:hypothetical protein [Fimbriiglobus ruber]|uniref:hypothetical protein n=1 Tax=Fimbriiglobus ruber TaxID=1908690 RepID=UPI00117A6382|nr:hypothetical protein [Fimbriiglobus ruber]
MSRDFSEVCPACGHQCMTVAQCHWAQAAKAEQQPVSPENAPFENQASTPVLESGETRTNEQPVDCRKEFEKWAHAHGYFDCGHWDESKQRYAGMELRAAWHAWQARGEPKRELSKAAYDVVAERNRQITSEGWSLAHDDKYDAGELINAAIAYVGQLNHHNPVWWKQYWPWNMDWYKPKNRRRDVIKAAALLVAEIERIDRLPDQTKEQGRRGSDE